MAKQPSAPSPASAPAAATEPASPKKKKGRQAPPANETKGERFMRMASTRVSNAMNAIRLIGNLSATNNYDYAANQIEAIDKMLSDAVSETMAKFKPKAAEEAKAKGSLIPPPAAPVPAGDAPAS